MIDWNIALSHFWQTVGLIIGSTFVIQISPIKLNPWGWVLKRIGKILNEELNDNISEISKKVDDLEQKVDNLETEIGEDKAVENRRRILRFSDECRRGYKHSSEHFTEIIEMDITKYKEYCRNHPEFENDKCIMSIDFIEQSYKNCLDSNNFL